MKIGGSKYAAIILIASLCAVASCNVRSSHNAEQSVVDSCAFRLGKLCDTLVGDTANIGRIEALLQALKDTAAVRNDSVVLEWVIGLEGLSSERAELIERADSLIVWCKNYSEILIRWQQAMQREATHDSSLMKMDDAYTSKELAAQKRNCDHLQDEIMRWRTDKQAFNRLYDTLSERTLVILSPSLRTE